VSISREQLRAVLRLPPEESTARSFDELGIDSWGFVELRATLEARFGLIFSDEQWVEMNCPDDIVRAQQGMNAQ
jgi:acyl carrier protein